MRDPTEGDLGEGEVVLGRDGADDVHRFEVVVVPVPGMVGVLSIIMGPKW